MKQSKHQRRDGAPGNRSTLPPRGTSGSSGAYWLYGAHAVEAALANPERRIRRIIASSSMLEKLILPSDASRKLPHPETMDPRTLDQLLGAQSVHQGIGVYVEPLALGVLEDVIHMRAPKGPLLVLDQVSDPHNVGAILRSAAAFNAVGVLTPKDHSAPETAVMAKAASGGLDIVPRISVTNLATAMRELKEAGWWITGLSGDAKQSLRDVTFSDKTVLILGAEGRGMRRLTAELCDTLVRLPMSGQMESLNVSNAAAIALYHCYTARK
jgi:23S rRNA (guanosine2251-2'-O)-methyltransferase